MCILCVYVYIYTKVEGVYETQVPLMFKLLMDLGCVCKLKNNMKPLETVCMCVCVCVVSEFPI